MYIYVHEKHRNPRRMGFQDQFAYKQEIRFEFFYSGQQCNSVVCVERHSDVDNINLKSGDRSSTDSSSTDTLISERTYLYEFF